MFYQRPLHDHLCISIEEITRSERILENLLEIFTSDLNNSIENIEMKYMNDIYENAKLESNYYLKDIDNGDIHLL